MVCKTYKCEIFGRKSELRLKSHLYVCVFHRAIPRSRSPALLVTFHPVKWLSMSIPISDAKIQQYIDICKSAVHY